MMNIQDQEFWELLENVINQCSMVIDRPKGTPHPRYSDTIYPLDYGYLSGTEALDGGGVDIWIGSDA